MPVRGLKPTEQEFCAQYDPHYAVQRTARETYRAMYPTGMTVGMPRVDMQPSFVIFILERWKRDPPQ